MRAPLWLFCLLFAFQPAYAGMMEEISGCDMEQPVCEPRAEFYDGGSVDVYQRAAFQVRRTKLLVRLTRPCYSSCTIFADMAHHNICISPEIPSVFGFHKKAKWEPPPGQRKKKIPPEITANGKELLAWLKKNGYRIVSYSDIFYSPELTSWIGNWGGLPEKDFLLMSFAQADALNLWRICK